MAPIITNIVPTTELEAINAMLAACGEAPLPTGTDLSTATQADVEMAINILRNTTREVLAMGWKFNTSVGYEVAPTATYNWVDTNGVTTALKIFLPPAGMLGFKPQKIQSQSGANLVDSEIMLSRKYTPGTKVFYDRWRSRDGFPADMHPYLYINPVWAVNFENMPETARHYVTKKAARGLIESGIGSDTLSTFVKRDEAVALRSLKRDQGEEEEYNFLQTADVMRGRGGRPGGPSGPVNNSRNRGSV